MGDEKNSEKDFEKEKKKKIEKEPEKQTKKAPKPKKRKKKGKAGFLFILLILLAVIGAGVYLLIPSKNRVSHNQYFGPVSYTHLDVYKRQPFLVHLCNTVKIGGLL